MSTCVIVAAPVHFAGVPLADFIVQPVGVALDFLASVLLTAFFEGLIGHANYLILKANKYYDYIKYTNNQMDPTSINYFLFFLPPPPLLLLPSKANHRNNNCALFD